MVLGNSTPDTLRFPGPTMTGPGQLHNDTTAQPPLQTDLAVTMSGQPLRALESVTLRLHAPELHLPAVSPTAVALACMILATLALLSILTLMMPAGGSGSDSSDRAPPAWSPEMEHSYSFREYTQDVLLWVMSSNQQPHQQQLGNAPLLRLPAPLQHRHDGTQ